MDRKVYCTNCGQENSAESNFCLFCGSELVKLAAGQMEMPQTAPVRTRRKKVIIIILCLILLALIGTALMVYMSSKSNVEYNSKIDKGDQYMRALEYDKAETSYLAAIGIEPKEEEAYLKVADLHIDQEQYEEAENILLRGQEETNAALVTKKLEQVQPYRLYNTYLAETLASEVGFADVDKPGTVNDIKLGLISAVVEDFNYDETPDFLTVSCEDNEKATLTISLYTCKKGKVVLLEEKTEDYATPDDSLDRHDVFLKQNKDRYCLVIGTEGLYPSGGYWMTRIYQIGKDITQVCDADFSQDMGFYYYGLNGEDVAVYEVEDIDNISEAEVSAVNEKGTSVLSAALEDYGFAPDRSIETNEYGRRITQLECDEKDTSEQKICDIRRGAFDDQGVDLLKSKNLYIVDYTGLQDRISSSDENKVSSNGKSQENSVSISNEDEAMEYALDYAKRNGKLDGIDNVGVICEGVEDNEYTIRIYEDMEDHIVTIFQWSVSKDGGIYDVIFDEWIHKEN